METLEYLYNCDDPFDILETWYQDIQKLNLLEPTAMTLITSSREGIPSARVVLLKSVSRSGFIFYTNYQSRKAKEIQENPHVALLIYSDFLERQIRVNGKAIKVLAKESDRYFASRPYESQIGAWASQQSRKLSSREELEKRIQKFKERYPQTVPRPPHWGGIQVNPYYFEFWIGAKYRFNHRIVFELDKEKDKDLWQKKILFP